jgi:hypothetical protein
LGLKSIMLLAALCKRRWDGSETVLHEARASLDGAGPPDWPMLRSARLQDRADLLASVRAV